MRSIEKEGIVERITLPIQISDFALTLLASQDPIQKDYYNKMVMAILAIKVHFLRLTSIFIGIFSGVKSMPFGAF